MNGAEAGEWPRGDCPHGQLWQLAVTWYSTRLEAESRRPAPNEMRIFRRQSAWRATFGIPRRTCSGETAEPLFAGYNSTALSRRVVAYSFQPRRWLLLKTFLRAKRVRAKY